MQNHRGIIAASVAGEVYGRIVKDRARQITECLVIYAVEAVLVLVVVVVEVVVEVLVLVDSSGGRGSIAAWLGKLA